LSSKGRYYRKSALRLLPRFFRQPERAAFGNLISLLIHVSTSLPAENRIGDIEREYGQFMLHSEDNYGESGADCCDHDLR
ncbi:hypothetical protein, partial [Chelatococcus sp. HY11]|uniref:hypothetical protein n=1 Tax=Chelatococcus sp. HY11 TaxID=2835634 RepID=UPI001BCF38F3